MTIGAQFLTAVPIRVCCCHDPAIDTERSDLQKYMVSRDEQFITQRSGMQIQWYVCKPLRRSHALDIQAMSVGKDAARVQAFRRGVVKVENLHTDASIHDFVPECFGPGGAADDGWTQDEFDYIPPDDVFDIGEVVLRRANFRRGMQPWFPPLPSSVRALAEVAYRPADESPPDASPRPDESAGPSTTSESERTDASGVPLGDATAKGPPTE